jgi:cysteinyl-tRNA synthetase
VEAGKPDPAVVDALTDDLNTAGAIAELHRIAGDGDAARLKGSAALLGLLEPGMGDWVRVDEVDLSAYAAALSDARAMAMETKDFSQVDAMKAALISAGVEVRMSKEGVDLVAGPDFDPSKLEELA